MRKSQEPPPGLPESDPHNDLTSGGACSRSAGSEPMPAAQLGESESFIAVAAGLEDLGLSRSDAQTLSQTVLTELVENVAEHRRQQPSAGRAGGRILVSAETYERRQNGIHEHMAEIAERALADSSHVLRLIVADSARISRHVSRRPSTAATPALVPTEPPRNHPECARHAIGHDRG